MEFLLLGQVEVLQGSQVVDIGGVRPRAVLATLLVDHDRVVPVPRLVEMVWGARPPTGAVATLQVHVSNLRKALRGVGAGERIRHDRAGYRIEVLDGELDLDRFTALMEAGRRAMAAADAATARSLLREACRLWRGDALQGLQTDRLRVVAERLDERRLDARELLLAAELRLDLADGAVEVAEDLVRARPLSERAQALLLQALAAAGRPAEASLAFHAHAATLRAELGTSPSARLRDLHRSILLGGDARTVTSGASPCVLPPEPSEFVGRAVEVAEVTSLVGSQPIITVTGTGGVGKSRVVLQVARRLAAGGTAVQWVDLANVSPGGDVMAATCQGLGWTSRAAADRRDIVSELGHDWLLVLDNCEHLAAGVRAMCQEFAAAGISLRLLATSRQPLGVPGELVWRLPPLLTPTDADGQADEHRRRFDAVALFAVRARQIDPAFVLEGPTLDAVTRICRALGGLPLAIEVVAARTRSIPLTRVAEQLLRTGGPVALATDVLQGRHGSIANSVAWSIDALPVPHRRTLAQLTIFPDTFGSEGVTAVCGPRATKALTDLVALSLVEPAGPRRFRVPAVVGAIARGTIDDPEGLERRFVGWVLSLAAAAVSRSPKAWSRLAAERCSIPSALDLAFQHDPVQAARLVDFAWRAFDQPLPGLLDGITRARSLSGLDDALRARLALAAGLLAADAGEWDLAIEALLESEVLGALAGDHATSLMASAGLGQGLVAEGSWDAGMDHLRSAAADPRADERGRWFAVRACARALVDAGTDLAEARHLLEQQFGRSERTTADPRVQAGASALLADLALAEGDPWGAWGHAHRALILGRAVDDLDTVALALDTMARAAPGIGCGDDALDLHAESLRLAARLGGARVLLRLPGIALTLARAARPVDAAQVLGLLEHLLVRSRVQLPAVPAQAAVEATRLVRSLVGEPCWAQQRREGRGLTAGDVVRRLGSEVVLDVRDRDRPPAVGAAVARS